MSLWFSVKRDPWAMIPFTNVSSVKAVEILDRTCVLVLNGWMSFELCVLPNEKHSILYIRMKEGQDRVLITFANMVKACCCVTNAFVQDCALCENYNTSHNLQISEGKFVYGILPTCTVTDFWGHRCLNKNKRSAMQRLIVDRFLVNHSVLSPAHLLSLCQSFVSLQGSVLVYAVMLDWGSEIWGKRVKLRQLL